MKSRVIFAIALVISIFTVDVNAQGLIVNKKDGEQINTTYRALDISLLILMAQTIPVL